MRRQTVVGEFDNPAFGAKIKPVTANSDDTVFQNPTYDDTPVITKLEGNTKPVERSAISRIENES